MARSIRLGLIVHAIDKATAPLRRISAGIQKLSRHTGIERVGARLRGVGRQMRTVGREAGRFSRRVLVGFGLVGAAAYTLTRRFASVGDDVAKMADRLGLGVEELQRLRHAFNLGGVAQGEADKSLRFFVRTMGDAIRGTGEARVVFEAMGISLKDTAGNVKPVRQVFDEVADAMEKQVDPAKRATAAAAIFGRAGVNMINTLRQGSEGIREQGRELDHLGIMTDEAARSAEKFIDEEARMRKALEFLGHTIGNVLLPKMTKLVTWLKNLFAEMRPAAIKEVGKAMRNLGKAANFVREKIAALMERGAAFVSWVEKTFPAIGEWIRYFRDAGSEIGWLTAAAGFAALVMSGGLLKAVLVLVGPLISLGVAVAGVVWSLGKLAVVGAAKALLAVAKALRVVVPLMWSFSASLLANPITWVVAAVVALAAAAWLIYKNWDGIAEWFARMWKRVKDGWQRFKKWMSDSMEKWGWTKIGEKWIQGLWDGMKKKWESIKKWAGKSINWLVNLFSPKSAEAGENKPGAPGPKPPDKPGIFSRASSWVGGRLKKRFDAKYNWRERAGLAPGPKPPDKPGIFSRASSWVGGRLKKRFDAKYNWRERAGLAPGPEPPDKPGFFSRASSFVRGRLKKRFDAKYNWRERAGLSSIISAAKSVGTRAPGQVGGRGAFGPQLAPAPFTGRLAISFDNPPPGMRVRRIESSSPDVSLDVEAGRTFLGGG